MMRITDIACESVKFTTIVQCMWFGSQLNKLKSHGSNISLEKQNYTTRLLLQIGAELQLIPKYQCGHTSST